MIPILMDAALVRLMAATSFVMTIAAWLLPMPAIFTTIAGVLFGSAITDLFLTRPWIAVAEDHMRTADYWRALALAHVRAPKEGGEK